MNLLDECELVIVLIGLIIISSVRVGLMMTDWRQ